MHDNELAALMSEFNQGAAIPQVEASAVKQMWEAVGRMAADGRLGSNMTMGMGAYAGYGLDTSSPESRTISCNRYAAESRECARTKRSTPRIHAG